MDSRKIIVSCYVLASVIVAFLVRSGFQYVYLTFYQVRRLPGIEWAREGVPLIAGAILFLGLFSNAKVNLFMDEVIAELKKVTWPGKEDVKRSTTVVIFCVVIASGILATLDLIWGKLISFLLKI